MSTSEISAERVRLDIFAAFSSLLSSPRSSITIPDLVANAHIDATLFYSQFESLDDVAGQFLTFSPYRAEGALALIRRWLMGRVPASDDELVDFLDRAFAQQQGERKRDVNEA